MLDISHHKKYTVLCVEVYKLHGSTQHTDTGTVTYKDWTEKYTSENF